MSSQMITVSIGGVLVSGIHAHVGVVQRIFLWSETEQISELKQPWLAIGDFNSIVSSEEKVGGRADNRRVMQEFNTYWGYKVGLRIASDHAPLLGGSKIWLTHPGFMELVSKCWNEHVAGDPPFVLLQKLKKLKHILRDWNWSVFGNVNVKIKEAEEEVKRAMQLSDNNPADTELLENLVIAENTYNSIEVQFKTMLQQKTRTKWVKEGSANTSFFHTNLKIRQSINFISELEDSNGDIISDHKKIVETLVNHFEHKFQFQEAEEADSLLEVIPEVITEQDQQMLDAIPTSDEIKEVVFGMDPESSPDPDGFSSLLYRACWDIIQDDVLHAIQFCWKRRFIPKGLNSNFLVLLPKIEGAKSPNHFRPIGLSNVNFKIITKIINTRMGFLMIKLISPQQVAYIKGRSIQEQIILASKLVNEMRKKRRGRNVALKLDVSQAYDLVNWNFLFQVLYKYGFSKSWCHWLQILFESAKFLVMINGGPHGFFSVSRGLRQGDPLSPTLFAIMEDVLSRFIHKMVEEGRIAPMVIKKGVHPTHLFFAGDVFILCNGSKKSVENLMTLLDKYQKASDR
ncbi:uncharacterized protein LOC113295510 [Papaver somniferum]|uniref:uncharacterized protein LOC113295510 n=1 Tax=Papaver somniferum TaxID=3469 RepID=UPI000E6FD41B|nr:uncharacterized protein LOC113295510 [Papaver somniferum]